MSDTFLFSYHVFGPVKSRRLGNSLGINLLPKEAKFCNFDCIYCECGFSQKIKGKVLKWIDASDLVNELINKIEEVKFQGHKIDSITFAGNGEPTLHPEFLKIMTDVVLTRNLMLPDAKISVLTNASTAHKPDIKQALLMADNSIFKLDAADEDNFKIINQNGSKEGLSKILQNIKNFPGKIIIQSLFVKGMHEGKKFDNSSDEAIQKWVNIINDLKPKQVMLYSLDRSTPVKNLEEIDQNRLQKIAEILNQQNINTLVA